VAGKFAHFQFFPAYFVQADLSSEDEHSITLGFGIYDFPEATASSGRYELIETLKRALRICGVLAQGDTPTGDQVVEGMTVFTNLLSGLPPPG